MRTFTGKKKTEDSILECWTYSIEYFHWISTGKYFVQFCFLLLEQTKPTLTFFNIWCYIQMWISKVIQVPLVSEQVVQYIQHCTKRHYAFPCHAYKSFNLKGRYFSCLALTLQLSLFRQNSVSRKTLLKVALCGVSCRTNTYSASLCTLLFFPTQETKAMQPEIRITDRGKLNCIFFLLKHTVFWSEYLQNHTNMLFIA